MHIVHRGGRSARSALSNLVRVACREVRQMLREQPRVGLREDQSAIPKIHPTPIVPIFEAYPQTPDFALQASNGTGW
jgi:hypothetical protein